MKRTRPDRCPGVTRPWPAEDGLLVRIRLVGGATTRDQLLALAEVAERFGDGRVHVTNRANLQVRAFPSDGDKLTDDALAALASTGLVGSLAHDLVRNIMVSPGTIPEPRTLPAPAEGAPRPATTTHLAVTRADLRPVATRLDELITSSPAMAQLPGKFLFCLDDGRGDLVDHWTDLGLVALDADRGQLRIGSGWGEVVLLTEAADHLARLAQEFVIVRGTSASAAWHVDELDQPFVPTTTPDPNLPAPQGPLPYGDTPAGVHHHVPEQGLDRAGIEALCGEATNVVVTPWQGILLPTKQPSLTGLQ